MKSCEKRERKERGSEARAAEKEEIEARRAVRNIDKL
jgi:hypothetical protein